MQVPVSNCKSILSGLKFVSCRIDILQSTRIDCVLRAHKCKRTPVTLLERYAGRVGNIRILIQQTISRPSKIRYAFWATLIQKQQDILVAMLLRHWTLYYT